MATARGIAKQNIRRAKHNAERIVDRLFYLVEQYSDYPKWSEAVKMACANAKMLSEFIEGILKKVP